MTSSVDTREETTQDATVIMTMNVVNAKFLKGSKPALNSFVRLQFADFDYKDVYYN
jgi:hypothetical protein